MANYTGYLKDKDNNQLFVSDIYSTDEVKTNKVFLNKPVYRRVYQRDVAKNGSVTIDLQSLSYSAIWINNDASFCQYNTSRTSCPVNWYSTTTDTGIAYINTTGVVIKNTSNWDRTYFVTIEYTK